MVRFELPWDLVEEILCRVPATYLRGQQFTCKRWNALFKDPEFIKKHSDKAAKPPYSILLFSSSKVNSLSVNINNMVVGPTKLSRNPKELSEEVEITQVVECSGLLLCSTKESIISKLVVVNPCTGQARWIKPRCVYDINDMYALGYENSNNQYSYEGYKILRFTVDRRLFEIFELKSNSWRFLANIPLKGKQLIFGRGVTLKGNTYWLSCHLDFEILSFDFATEIFTSLSLPFILPRQMFDSNNLALSVVREDQLSVLHVNHYTRQMKIWVSNKTDDDTETALSWSKSFQFDLDSDFDLSLLRFMSFFIDEEKKVIVSCGRMTTHEKKMIYIVGEHDDGKIFSYCISDQSNPHIWFLFRYVPSLVSLNPPMYRQASKSEHNFWS